MKIISIKATNTELTPAIADYVRKRIAMFDKVVDGDDQSARVVAEVGKTTQHHKEGNFFFAEFNMHIAGKDFRARVEKDDLYAAIDEAKDEIIREVTGWKNKRRTLIRWGGAAIKNFLRGWGEIGGKIKSFRFRRTRR